MSWGSKIHLVGADQFVVKTDQERARRALRMYGYSAHTWENYVFVVSGDLDQIAHVLRQNEIACRVRRISVEKEVLDAAETAVSN